MTSIIKKLESELQELSSKEKAALAHFLIEELDGERDTDVAEVWRAEAVSRCQAFVKGHLSTVSGKEAMSRARDRLK